MFLRIESSLQVTALLPFANDDTLGDQELSERVAVLTEAFLRIKDADPEYTAALVFGQLARNMTVLVGNLRRRGLTTLPLLQAYRTYLVRNSTQRCSELSFLHRNIIQKVPWLDPIAALNDLIRSEPSANGRLKSLNLNDLQIHVTHAPWPQGAGILASKEAKTLSAALLDVLESDSINKLPTHSHVRDDLVRRISLYCSTLPGTEYTQLQALLEIAYLYERLFELDASPEHQELVAKQFLSDMSRLYGTDAASQLVCFHFVKKIVAECEAPAGQTQQASRRRGALHGAQAHPVLSALITMFVALEPSSCIPK